MMSAIVAYDVMRIAIGPAFLTPRGIDRVDLALANYLFENPSSNNVGILPTPVGVFVLTPQQVKTLLEYVEKLWAERADASSETQLQTLFSEIEGKQNSVGSIPNITSLSFRDQVRRMLHMLYTTGLFTHRLARHTVPAKAVYLNVGQLGLAMPSFFKWLDKRRDVTCAMMMHDAIPVDYPHLVSAKAPVYHRQMIRTAAKHADCLIFNSHYTRNSVGAVMTALGRDSPPGLVRSLSLPAAFLDVKTGIEVLAGTRYFVSVSTIEPRKNFSLLLIVWQRLVETMGAAAPHLIIVGAPGNSAGHILAPLHADAALARRVHHMVGLSSPALASLMLGATGVLCPSLAEGFGLPLLEASALGVPTIASDIPAHREVAVATTVLLQPDDQDAWMRAVLAVPDQGIRQRPAIPPAMTEAAYCADIVDFVSNIGSRAG